jgi:hypothetical protein
VHLDPQQHQICEAFPHAPNGADEEDIWESNWLFNQQKSGFHHVTWIKTDRLNMVKHFKTKYQ